jgi:hypothetical protein
MIDEPGPLQSQPAHGSDFVAQFINLLERDQRKRRTYRIGVIIAGVIVACFLPVIYVGITRRW